MAFFSLKNEMVNNKEPYLVKILLMSINVAVKLEIIPLAFGLYIPNGIHRCLLML